MAAAVTSVVESVNGQNENISVDALDKISMGSKSRLPAPPTFKDKYEEREWVKFRLAQAFRIFGEDHTSGE